MGEGSRFATIVAATGLAVVFVAGCATTPEDIRKQEELAGAEKAGQRTDTSPIPPPTTVPQPK